MSGLPNILLLFQIVGGIAETATNGNIVAQKIILFRKKRKKLLTCPLGHVLILRLISKLAASLCGTRDKKRVPSPLVCTRLAAA